MNTYQQQCLLGYLGYDPGPIDGLDGPRTKAALERFREDYGMGAEGLIAAIAGTAAKVDKQTGTFWDSIKYFRRDEDGIRCTCNRCGGFPVEPTENLMRTADSIREELGPMTPSSTVRCKAHNDELTGSAKNSRHLSGKAMDFMCFKSTPEKIEECLQRKKNAGEIRYWYKMESGWYHFDVE